MDDGLREVIVKIEVDTARSANEYAQQKAERKVFVEDVEAKDFLIGIDAGEFVIQEVSEARVLKRQSQSGNKIVTTGSLDDSITISAFNLVNGTLQVNSGAGDDLFLVSQLNFAKLDGGAGRDTFRWTSSLPLQLRSLPDQALVSIESIDLGSGSDLLIASADDLSRVFGGTSQLIVKLEPQNEVLLGGNWTIDPPIFEAGEAYHSLRREGLSLKVQTGQIWTNPLNPYDVDRNGKVQPIDALIQINYLNLLGPGELPLPTNAGDVPDSYLDSSGNGLADPLDALLVINFLNLQLLGGSAEPDLAWDSTPIGHKTVDPADAKVSRLVTISESILPSTSVMHANSSPMPIPEHSEVAISKRKVEAAEIDRLFDEVSEFWKL